jgi:hypothetical protein
MTTLRTLKKLLLGETWILAAGLATVVAATLLMRELLGAHWHDLGGFVLLALVATLIVVSVGRSARPR